MPPRFAYWTIIVGNQPTAFRAATREELLPTLKQLQSRQPDAVLKWFSRGKLWESPAEATDALRAQRAGGSGERRGPAWRPGGRHEDPRDRFKVPRDVKRQRFAARLRRDRTEDGAPPPPDEGQGKPPLRPRGPYRPQKPGGMRDRGRPDRGGEPGRSGPNRGGGGTRSGGGGTRGGPNRGGGNRGGSGNRGGGNRGGGRGPR